MFGTPNYKSVELLDPLIKYIKEHFSDTYEFIEDAHKALHDLDNKLKETIQ